MKKMHRVAIIGCGGIAGNKHMPNLKRIENVEMVAFCDIIEERAINACKVYGSADAKVYTDYKELLKDESIDIVHVCTPNREHSFITIDALEAGKDVYCEKPMAKTVAEAEAMLEAAKKTGKVLTIGYNNRQNQDVQFVKKACAAGELGDIYYAKALALRRRAVPTWGVFMDKEEQGGGPLIDIGTHALDMTLWAMDNYKPKMVVGTKYKKLYDKVEGGSGNAWGEWDPETFEVEDSAFGFITMENGATINLEASWALNMVDCQEATMILCGDKAGADNLNAAGRLNGVKHGMQYTENTGAKAGVAFFDADDVDSVYRDIKQWIDALDNGVSPCVLPEQALVVTKILAAIYESSETGKPVYLA